MWLVNCMLMQLKQYMGMLQNMDCETSNLLQKSQCSWKLGIRGERTVGQVLMSRDHFMMKLHF